MMKSPVLFDRNEHNEPLPIQVGRTRAAVDGSNVTGMVSLHCEQINAMQSSRVIFVSTERARELAHEIIQAADEADGLAEHTPGKKL